MSAAGAKSLNQIAAQWREARKLYAVYSALLERFALGVPPCHDLESPVDRNEPAVIQRVEQWLAQMDERVHVHQLRQLLQTSKLGTEENLRALIEHHLQKEHKNEADRDKIDFLLVQYLSSCAPPGFYEKQVSFDEIAQVLEPVLGEVGATPPKWLEPLDQATNELDHLRSLRDLLEQGTLEQMRKLKANAGEMYFGPTGLVAITRFNFLVRRTFVRLIAADLHAIRFGLHELDRRAVKSVDCTRADLSRNESIEDLRQICHEWKKPFRAAYAAGQNFRELIEIRSAVEEALAHAPEPGSATPEKAIEAAVREAPAAHTGNGLPAEEFTASSVASPAAPAPTPPSAIALEFSAAPAKQSSADPALIASHHAPAPAAEVNRPVGSPAAPVIAAAAGDVGLTDLGTSIEQITHELAKLNIKEAAVANVALGAIKLMLSTWEVSAFLKAGDETSETLQRAVAARAVLVALMDRRNRGQGVDMRSAVKTAQQEAGRIQERIAAAKQAKDIDSAVNLAATSKRLLAALESAEKPAK